MRKNNFVNIKLIIGIVAIVVGIVTIILYNFLEKKETIKTSADLKPLGAEEVVNVVEEEIIQVAQDLEQDEKDEKEVKEVTFNNKTVKVPKSKVSSGNSAEDSERSKKNGGQVVSQEKVDEIIKDTKPNVKGIDVSEHQGRINWAQVASSGVEFAMIRCGYRGNSLGGIYEDAYFKTNVAGAKAVGIKIGIYFYSTAINEEEALEEAAWVVQKIAPYAITFPVVYDFEDFKAYRCSNVDGAQATQNALTFLNYVKANGYVPMMYANKNDITNRLSRSSFSCKFWLAHYTSKTDYTGSYDMWQYTSKGSVPGISGNVDMNVAYFNYDKVASAKHEHKYEIFVEDKVLPTCEKEGIKIMKCTCGEKKEVQVEKSKHEYDEWTILEEATEEKDGLRKHICKICEFEEEEAYKLNVEEEKDDPNNSDKNNAENDLENNQNNKDNNENNKDEGIESPGDNNTSEKEDEKDDENKNENNDANQNENKDENSDTNIPSEESKPHTHDFTTEFKIIKEPTCTEKGEKVGVCSCGEEDTIKNEISETGIHNYVDGKCVCGLLENVSEETSQLDN